MAGEARKETARKLPSMGNTVSGRQNGHPEDAKLLPCRLFYRGKIIGVGSDFSAGDFDRRLINRLPCEANKEVKSVPWVRKNGKNSISFIEKRPYNAGELTICGIRLLSQKHHM